MLIGELDWLRNAKLGVAGLGEGPLPWTVLIFDGASKSDKWSQCGRAEGETPLVDSLPQKIVSRLAC